MSSDGKFVILAGNEEIVKTEKSAGWEIHATNKRIVFRKQGMLGKKVIETSYRYISSIEYSKRNPIIEIAAGMAAIVMSFVWPTLPQLERLHELFAAFPWFIPLVFFCTGLPLIFHALFLASSYTIHIVGRKPIVVSANVEGIIRTIREYSERVEAKIVEKDRNDEKPNSPFS